MRRVALVASGMSVIGCVDAAAPDRRHESPAECTLLEGSSGGVDDDVVTPPREVAASWLVATMPPFDRCENEIEAWASMNFQFVDQARAQSVSASYLVAWRGREMDSSCAISATFRLRPIDVEGDANPYTVTALRYCDRTLRTRDLEAAQAIDAELVGVGWASGASSGELQWLPVAGRIPFRWPRFASCDGPTVATAGPPDQIEVELVLARDDLRRIQAMGGVTLDQLLLAR